MDTFADIFDNAFGGMVAGEVLPLNKIPLSPNQAELRARTEQAVLGTTIGLMTCDNVKLDAVWSEAKPGAATAVIFHTNGTTLENMAPIGTWYRERGMSVLLLTIRGYPGSEGDAIVSGENGLYRDVHAAVRHVFDKGVTADKVVLHGVSLGAALALDGAKRYGVMATVDQGFATLQTVAKNTFGEGLESMINKAFPAGQEYLFEEKDQIAGCQRLVTDTFHNTSKIAATARDCFIICGEEDVVAPPSDAVQLFEAKHGVQPDATSDAHAAYIEKRAAHFVTRAGGHMQLFFTDEKAAATYELFLRNHGLLEQ